MKMKTRILLVLCAASFLSGCATVKPWEKEGLSDPIMIIDENPINSGIKEHFIDYREGVEGATGAESGGCGCG
jgi:PBP1b-binding outer membrane lipoprotein LpoB